MSHVSCMVTPSHGSLGWSEDLVNVVIYTLFLL